MKKMKKICAAMVLVFLSAALLQGCGKTAETPAAGVESSWEAVAAVEIPHPANFVGFSNESFGITVGPSGECHYTQDGGKTWPKSQNESMCRFGMEILNESYAWNCGNGSTVRRTKDGGKIWEAVADFGDSEPLQCRFLSFSDEKTGWIASPQRIGFTQDGGMNWTEETLPDGVSGVRALSLRTANDRYLLDPAGILHITADGGKTWTRQDLGKDLKLRNGEIPEMPTPSAAIRFSDAEHGLVIISAVDNEGGKTWSFETSDGGKTWKKEQILLGDTFHMTSAFLSKDGKLLTVANTDGKVKMLRKKA